VLASVALAHWTVETSSAKSPDKHHIKIVTRHEMVVQFWMCLQTASNLRLDHHLAKAKVCVHDIHSQEMESRNSCP